MKMLAESLKRMAAMCPAVIGCFSATRAVPVFLASVKEKCSKLLRTPSVLVLQIHGLGVTEVFWFFSHTLVGVVFFHASFHINLPPSIRNHDRFSIIRKAA